MGRALVLTLSVRRWWLGATTTTARRLCPRVEQRGGDCGGWVSQSGADGRRPVVAWGDNGYGQTDVPGGLSNVVAIAAGEYHSLALTAEGTVVAWGDNDYGQTNVPSGLSNVVAIAAGGYHSLALTAEGRVVAWGDNGYGQTNVPAG